MQQSEHQTNLKIGGQQTGQPLLQSEWLGVTLFSIGDAVIATDSEKRVTFINPIAEQLTGWIAADAVGQKLDDVFRIVNEDTGRPVANPVDRALREGIVVGLANHTVLIARDGGERAIDDSAAPIRTEAGDVVGVVLVFRDVSQQRMVERRRSARLSVNEIMAQHYEILPAANELLRRVCQSMGWPAGWYRRPIDSEADYESIACWDAATSQESTASLQRWRPSAPVEGLAADVRRRMTVSTMPVRVASEEIRFTGATQHVACPVAGEEFHGVLEFHTGLTEPLDDDSREMLTTFGRQFGLFIERRRAEQRLQTNEQDLRDFFDNAPLGMFWSDRSGKITRINQAELEMLGYEEAEVLGRPLADFCVPRSSAELLQQRLLAGETVRELSAQMQHKDGPRRDVLFYANALFEAGVFVHSRCFTRDVTANKKAEETRTLLAAIVSASDDAIVSKTLQGIILSWNDGAQRLFGYTAAEAIGQSIEMLIPPELRHEERMILGKIRAGIRLDHYETVRVSKSGKRINISLTVSPLRDERGVVIGASKVARDITQRKRDEAALREREERYELVVAGAGAAIWDWDVQNKRVVYSPHWKELRGLSGVEISDSQDEWIQRIHPDDVARVMRSVQDHFEGKTAVFVEEYRVQHRDGHWIWILDRGLAQRDNSGCIVRMAGSETDITPRKEAVEALQQSEARYRAVVESQSEMVCRFRSDGTILFVNGPYAAARGTRPENLSGVNFWEFIEEADSDAIKSLLGKLTPEQPEVRIENRFRTTAGVRWTLWTNRALAFDERGHWTEAQSTGIDITDRKRAESSLRFLAEASKLLSSLVDYKRTLQQVAQIAVPDIADWCAVNVLGAQGGMERLAIAHVDPEKARQLTELHNTFPQAFDRLHGQTRMLETGTSILRSHTGDEWLREIAPDEEQAQALCDLGLRSLICVPIAAKGRVLGGLTFAITETDRHYGPEDLAMAQDLGFRAGIAVDNALLYEAAKEADRKKDEFLAMLAHELRNPLAPIRAGLDLLAVRAAEDQPTIEVMREQVQHLVRLVDDLLDASRIMRGKIELRKEIVELGPLIDRSIQATRAVHDHSTHDLQISKPAQAIWLEADPVRLIQVFENLLNNAFKYTPDGGRIELHVDVDGEFVEVKIADNGIGIEPELLSHIFELFTQAPHSLDRAQGGLGIGLTLVQRLVELHGGQVWARSEGSGQGSSFVVRLPVTAPPAGSVRVDGPPLPVVQRRVLIVDDNLAAAEMLALLLRTTTPHEILVAHEGMAAIEMVKSLRPEVILLDIGLPGMDGYQVAQAIRTLPQGEKVLLVALTGYGQEEDRQRSHAAGFDIHLVKPVETNVLERILAGGSIPPAGQTGARG